MADPRNKTLLLIFKHLPTWTCYHRDSPTLSCICHSDNSATSHILWWTTPYLKHVRLFVTHVFNDDSLGPRYFVGGTMLFGVAYSLKTANTNSVGLGYDYMKDEFCYNREV